MNQEPIKISDSEWEVMRVIWNEKCSDAKGIYDVLGVAKNWKMATIKTLLGRLVKKGALSTEQEGKKFLYRPLVNEMQVIQDATTELLAHICAKKMGQTISEMLSQVELTEKDIQEINEQLAKKKPVKTIKCDCLPGQCDCHKNERGNENETNICN